ncbi:unnamed protein product [Soboliphyme baturini]|uniref:Pept_C1 domain-containing protein n=1 Tax=Soboliphyme baturini TaxID=241478 RepID=A0A183J2J4_9BILA|nr:unnamed protein product [Soboliphyme baturini]
MGLNDRLGGMSNPDLVSLLGSTDDGAYDLPDGNYNPYLQVPPQFDARQNWFQCGSIQFIRDQGQCGSCWAVSTASIMSDRLCIITNGVYQPYVSDQYVTTCCTDCGNACQGGTPFKALQYWQQGVPNGGPYGSTCGCQPYTIGNDPSQSSCSQNCISQYPLTMDQTMSTGGTAYKLKHVQHAMQDLMLNGPFVTRFHVYSDFFYYKSGVYTHVWGSNQGDHAVRVIGYGTESGKPYWLVTNSWNVSWGDNGLFKILRGSNECGIEDLMSGVYPNVQAALYKEMSQGPQCF